MSLRPLNRDPKYMSGPYASMFNIPVHQGNAGFAQNPYKGSSCHPSDITCFSLVNGVVPCYNDNRSQMVWRATGDITKIVTAQPTPLKL